MALPAVETPVRDRLAGGAVVIANPAAAGVTPQLVEDLVGRLRARLPDVAAVWTTRPGEAGDLAASTTQWGGAELVVAVGGDGTIREVAEGLHRGPAQRQAARGPAQRQAARGLAHHPPGAAARPALLALPAGSGNSLCRNVWGERDWPEVVDLALDPERSRIRHLDLLRLREPDLDVLLGASSGFLAQVLIGARDVTGVTGRDRYFAAAVRVLDAMPSHPTRVRVDGVTVHDGPASSVTVGGGRFRAYAFQFLPSSVLDDGMLDVCAIGALSGTAVHELAAVVPAGEHVGRPDVSYARGRRVSIERTDGEPLVAEYDGEVWSGAGPVLTIDVVPGAVPVLAPRRAPAG